MRLAIVLAVMFATGVFACPAQAQQPLVDHRAQCAVLLSADFSGTEDAATTLSAATSIDAAAPLPGYCEVAGAVDQRIKFKLRLPAEWNGRFAEVGCGGWCGVIPIASCDRYLRRGYACIATNMGHDGAITDGRWAQNDLRAQIDFGYRATHVVALAGKAVTLHFYQSAIRYSYFFGCSTGGYQGVMEAQRFPWDFDGIIAGAPDIDQSQAGFRGLWYAKVRQGSDRKPVLGESALRLLHDAVLARCDLDDGVKDGIVGDPTHCGFVPSALQCKPGQTSGCLSPDQVKAAELIYSGPVDAKGRRTSTGSFLKGSELAWATAWPTDSIEDYFRYGLSGYSAGPNWKLSDFDFNRDYQRLGLAAQYDNTNPDLRKLKAAGGKLIVYHGTTDTIDPPAPVIDYYETVERTMGGRANTESFFRLFLVPGMNHCGGGIGAMDLDWVSALENWVENGKAPDAVIGARASTDGKPGFTRPLYPYPAFAKYTGRGDPNAAQNFKPAAAR